MGRIQFLLNGFVLFLAALTGKADTTWEYSVQASATVQASPARITLNWPQDVNLTPNSYTIYRKAATDTSWGSGTTLPGTATTYTDNNVTVGTAYEYQIVKVTSLYNGYGYIYSGINVPMTENRGKLLLIVDNTLSVSLTNELARLQQDLVGDGWTVIRQDVSRSATVASVKSWITSQYSADPANVKMVFLFGHVPVPYSGDIVPDGHVPNHQGAWPCDGFYGDMTGSWRDTTVNDSAADYSRNWNVPADSKYDPSSFPAPIQLMVGRVDLSNLPGQLVYGGPGIFPSELDLTRNYLNKDHNFRTKQFELPRRAIVGDYFGARNGEGFAASGWRNYAPYFGAANTVNMPNQGTWAAALQTTPYLCAYGCGAGSFSTIGGLGVEGQYNNLSTPYMVTNDLKFAFGLFFGSWLGDWDSQDNIMRGVLALPSYGLACAWSGRPHWFLHHMGLGETIGYGTRLTQNNGPSGLYQNQVNTAAGQIHAALMGDPSLRLFVAGPPSAVTATTNGTSIALSWTASTDSVVGYHVYRASANGAFTRLTSSPITGTSYTDSSASGAVNYMVRGVKLESTASGTYYNPSQGAFLYAASATSGSTSSGGSSGSSTNSSGSNTNTTGSGSSTNGTSGSTGTSTNFVAWVDDSLPAGAVGAGDNGDGWNWVASSPTPYHGSLANQSSIGTGLHQHYFTGATSTLTVNTGDVLCAYVYFDPANLPSEIMLQWNNGSWEHRAYWGANNILYGVNGTASCLNMGPLPAAGQWVLLQVPASQLGLEGSTVTGMAFSQYGGRATWDYAGKGSAMVSTGSGGTTNGSSGGSTNSSSGGSTNTISVSVTNIMSWVDDTLPTGAVAAADGGDSWNWASSNPSPYHGSLANQSTISTGLHQHYFTGASSTLTINTGDVLCAYIYLDPANLPSEVMLQWNNGSWEHRAYWGANNISYGVNGTASCLNMGALPATGQWTLLQVPASQVGLEGSSLSGMAFSLYGGRATWDYASKYSVTVTNMPVSGGGSTNSGSGSSTNTVTAWVDDSLPTGASPATEGGDAWQWTNSNPVPYHGSLANQSTIGAGLHQHYFSGANSTLTVNTGEVLTACVYLDPANLPSEIMLQWNDGSWEHRAYWGANNISYGTSGTTSRAYMGQLPAAGQWALLQVPASQVALEGSTINGMAFSLYDGRATWDYAGKSSTLSSGSNGGTTNGTSGSSTNTTSGGTTNTTSGSSTNPAQYASSLPSVSAIDYLTPQLPNVGDNTLHVLTPTMLELKLINTKALDPAQVAQWNLVNSSLQFVAPLLSSFVVTANGQPVAVTAVGFKRRPLSAPLATYDLRIENSLYLQLASPVSDNQTIQVTNPGGLLWPSTVQFAAVVNPLRYSPAIHVNQEGYMPNYTKQAMVGYYAGSLGELSIPASGGYKIVDANTGAQVYSGTLTLRADSGYTYTPAPYQLVYQADFSTFNTPGEYRLVVPGMGGSLPFLINDGVALSFARAYALGLYHQRCGTNTAMPYTRFDHGVCHAAPATVPTNSTAYSFSWTTIAGYANSLNANNPPQIAPALTSPSAQLFPFINAGSINVSGGHHDAGDYSKYTINSASLIHYLMFAVDSLPGVAALDNLGIPESGDGISDVMQEAKWEADFLSKMQDADGGFYFLVYPQNREYESNVTPDHGDPQVVWPKTTSVTAASVAALAQCATSPLFKSTYPATAAMYLQKAKLGWQFLTNAIARYGKSGAYQKITHYGDNFADNDELAWAACQMYLATGDPSIHQMLLSWFDPNDPATWRWGWWHMDECYGHAVRSYAFAVQSGRAAASQLDATFLSKCQTQIASAATDMLNFSRQCAYGSSFPTETKAVQGAGWYFSTDEAFDLAVAYQLNPNPDFMTAILANMNYEGGCNPVNVCYVTGLGWKRTRDIVSQWHINDTNEFLPPSGIPVGNIQNGFSYLSTYGSELEGLCFPPENAATAPYPYYDRWGDSWNVSDEMVVLNQGRSIGTLAFLAAQSPYKMQAWKAPASALITVPTTVVPVGSSVTVSFQVPGMDLTSARVTWEARDQSPAYGPTFTFAPLNMGVQWVAAEAQWPDGRRAFAKASFTANSTNLVWVEDAIPAGGTGGADGGDSWNWVSSSPTPYSGSSASQSAVAAGEHQHFFSGASATLSVNTGDVLYAYVYIDPSNLPTEIMLQWNNGSWEHRAYWGANSISFGTDGTASRLHMGALPTAGQWVKLSVPASQVGLEGSTLNGMAFTLYGGRAAWDCAGRVTTKSIGTATGLTSITSTLALSNSGATLSWSSTAGAIYQVTYKNSLSATTWTPITQVTATGATTTWTDTSAVTSSQRFYQVIRTF